jgi:hypothetical protein
MENTATRMAFPRIMVGTVRMDLAPAGPDALSRTAGNNWFRKHQYSLAEKWLGAISGAQGLAPGQVAARDALREVIRQDDAAWGGWYRRNGGEIEFIGDHFGDSDWTSLLMVIGCAGVLVKLARYGPPVAVVKAAPAGSRRKPRASG